MLPDHLKFQLQIKAEKMLLLMLERSRRLRALRLALKSLQVSK